MFGKRRGQQAPLFAALGAKVTVFDLSSNMLEKDKTVAYRENMTIQIEQGKLKSYGILIMCAPNPINFLCDFDEETQKYIACNTLPYKSYEHDDQGDWVEYGHTLEDYIGGQLAAGFLLTGFYEDKNGEIESDFTTRAIKIST